MIMRSMPTRRLHTHKKSFTLIELVIVLIVIGILIAMIPTNLRWLENHVQLSLVTQKLEDTWDAVSVKMRQGRAFDAATLSLGSTWWSIQYSWWIQWDKTETILFEKKVELTTKNQRGDWELVADNQLKWTMWSYGISCIQAEDAPTLWADDLVRLSYEWMQACYKVQLDSCILKRMKCK